MSKLNAVEIEQSLLGYLIENGVNTNVIVNYLSPDDFFEQKNKEIYKTILQLSEKGIEVELVALINELKKANMLQKVGGRSYLVDLMQQAGLKSNINKYAMEISNFAQLRLVQQNLVTVQNDIQFKKKNVEEVLNDLSEKMMQIVHPNSTRKFKSAFDLIKDSIKLLESHAAGNIVSGVKSQYRVLDEMTSGFQKGDLIILASRPSMGKTSFALNIATNISRTRNVAFFSLEMPAVQLINRILSAKTNIESNKLRNAQHLTTTE
jgi:replicative DNA helicase